MGGGWGGEGKGQHEIASESTYLQGKAGAEPCWPRHTAQDRTLNEHVAEEFNFNSHPTGHLMRPEEAAFMRSRGAKKGHVATQQKERSRHRRPRLAGCVPCSTSKAAWHSCKSGKRKGSAAKLALKLSAISKNKTLRRRRHVPQPCLVVCEQSCAAHDRDA